MANATFTAKPEPTDAIAFHLTATQRAHAAWGQKKAIESRNNPERRHESLPHVDVPSCLWELVK